jgi:DNA-binding response OmpR family regulator
MYAMASQNGSNGSSGTPHRPERILIVAKDEALRDELCDTLQSVTHYVVNRAGTFEEALSEILLTPFDLVVTETELPDLSGIDLLAVVGGLRPESRVIVIDDDLSARSAVAIYRLGAVDYLYKPLNMAFVLMQIEKQMAVLRSARNYVPVPEAPSIPQEDLADRAKRIDPRTRPVALVLNRQQFMQINAELINLHNQVQASFVGLVDADGNMVGAAGTLEEFDLQLLTHALNIDHRAQQSLANILEEKKFHSSFFEGEHSGVYITEFGGAYGVSLAVICANATKAGSIWHYSKRTAAGIDAILKAIPQPRLFPRLMPDAGLENRN